MFDLFKGVFEHKIKKGNGRGGGDAKTRGALRVALSKNLPPNPLVTIHRKHTYSSPLSRTASTPNPKKDQVKSQENGTANGGSILHAQSLPNPDLKDVHPVSQAVQERPSGREGTCGFTPFDRAWKGAPGQGGAGGFVLDP